MTAPAETADLLVIGAGAAGLATAIFTARRAPHLRVVCLDGATKVGAKILISGGSRCNVTNSEVTERDYWGGSSRVVRNVLRGFPASRAAAFFRDLGVALHEEEDGKLFPDTHSSRTVLEALLRALGDAGAELRTGRRVHAVYREGERFVVEASGERWLARHVLLATGGRSLPKTGSDGFGYGLARGLGHGCVGTTPALVPLLLGGAMHAALAGVAHRAGVRVRTASKDVRLEGALLWTHFGISGPLALNASRHWLRAELDGDAVDLVLTLVPEETFESTERWLLTGEQRRPRALVSTVLAERLPAAVASAWLDMAGLERTVTLAHLTRGARRQLVRTLLETPLVVRGSRGYNYAEVTAGGIPLEEIEPATMESRLCPGLFFAGEVLDVDGRLGGFNFQWAWASAWVAANGIAALSRVPTR